MSETRVRASFGDLLDVNVWLALAVQEHVHHQAATAYWRESSGTTRYFCRVSAMSLVRLLTHPGLMSGAPLTLAAAWQLYERFRALPGVEMLGEPDGLDPALASFVDDNLPARLFTDAYLAALALSAGARIVSFDRDFERFVGPTLKRLQAASR